MPRFRYSSERAYYVARRFVRRFGSHTANERAMSLHWRMIRIARSGATVDDYLPAFRWLANYRGELLRLAREG